MNRSYAEAIRKAGGTPIHLIPCEKSEVGHLLDRLDGLLLCGGPDIDPQNYGEKAHETVQKLNKERESFDFALARAAKKAKIPVLGICLGSQIMNVIRGGSLYQDIPSQIGKKVPHRPSSFEEVYAPMHIIELNKEGKLFELYGRERISVNSYHHQAVKNLGAGLQVEARSVLDGVVEALSDPNAEFVLGVQFHPELQKTPPGLHDALFRAFIEACSAKKRVKKRRPAKKRTGLMHGIYEWR